MPNRHHLFARDEIFPSWWPNAIQAFLSSATQGFAVTKLSATTIQVVASAGDGLVAIAIQGRWRYIEATVNVAHPGGAAGSYDIYVTAADNNIVNVPNPNTDSTDYTFALAIRAVGSPPATALYRKVGTLTWDGAQITQVTQTAGSLALPSHAASHRPGGSDEVTHQVLTAQSVLEVGQIGQIRAGRQLALADFATLCGLPAVPVGLFNLGSVANLGTGGALVNKGSVPFGVGINGLASTAAVFAGSNAQAFYIVDTGANDPFRIATGTIAAWVKTGKRGLVQNIIAKTSAVAGQTAYQLWINNNVAELRVSSDGTALVTLTGSVNIADDYWHHVCAVIDGSMLKLYVDGVLDVLTPFDGNIFGGSGPLNIGGQNADAGTGASNPHYGRIDEAFITVDALSESQVLLMYCAQIAHGFPVVPTRAQLSVRRLRRGGALVPGTDFPATPARLYLFAAGALTDSGSGGVALTNVNAAAPTAAVDGSSKGAFNFAVALAQNLTATDTGLPAGTASRTIGCWVKTQAGAVTQGVLLYGTAGSGDIRIDFSASRLVRFVSGSDTFLGPDINDGRWHFVVLVETNTPTDGLKRKGYVDGRLVGASTVLNSITLIGAGGLKIGALSGGGSTLQGQIARPFVYAGAMTAEQILTVYNKGSQALPPSPKEEGVNIEAMDATNVYAVFDGLEGSFQVDLAVAA